MRRRAEADVHDAAVQPISSIAREFVFTSRLRLPGERSTFYRAAARGIWTRIRPGVYVDATSWRDLGPAARHLARARAAAILDPGVVFSHPTAALVWELPLVVPPPPAPQTVQPATSGGRSSRSMRRFAGAPSDIVTFDGMRVSGLADTVAAVAERFDATVAVPIVDAALGGRAREATAVTREQVSRIPVSRAPRRAEFAIGFGDGRSGSAGESLSRVAIHRSGLPAPELQARFDDDHGLIGFTDFWWPEAGVVGEFDGLGKYRRDLSGHGRSPADVVIAEKRREDRLRSLGPRVVRWGWATAHSVPDLRQLLVAAGVRPESSHRRR